MSLTLVIAAGEIMTLSLTPFIILGLTTVITGLIGALFAYIGARAQREIAHRDFERVLGETRATTDAVKRIEQQFTQGNIVFAAEIAYRQRQLAEFYGPIYASLKLSELFWPLLMDGKIQSIRDPLMDRIRTENDMMLKLLQTKFDLVEGESIPECFATFATAILFFNLGTKIGLNNMSPLDVHALKESEYPRKFYEYIYETTEKLKRRLEELYTAARSSVDQ